MVPRHSDRPGLVRSVPPASADDQRKLGAKHETRRRIHALWPGLSRREYCERYLFMDESTLRGQLDPRALNRKPSDRLLELLEHYEAIARHSRGLGAVG